MPDVYATISEAEPAVVEQLVDVLELRAADPQQREMREAYLSDVEFPAGARVVEVGCGSGPVARALASWPGVGEVVGVDPSPGFLAKGRELARDLSNLTFVEGDARALPLEDGSFDVVVFHTTLCHVPEPELALAEAFRVLGTGGWVVFDGDYATATCAGGEFGPLQTCAEAAAGSYGDCSRLCGPPGSSWCGFGATATRRRRLRGATCSRSSLSAPMLWSAAVG